MLKDNNTSLIASLVLILATTACETSTSVGPIASVATSPSVSATTAAPSQTTMEADTVLLMKMTDGSAVSDATNRHTPVDYGTADITDSAGHARYFSGPSGKAHVTLDYSNDFSFGNGDFSIWVSIKTTSTTHGFVFSNAGSAGTSRTIGLQLNNTGTLDFFINSNGTNYLPGSAKLVNDGLWHDIQINRVNGLITMYIDGAVATTSANKGNTDPAFNTLVIGMDGSWDTAYSHFQGSIKNFKINAQ